MKELYPPLNTKPIRIAYHNKGVKTFIPLNGVFDVCEMHYNEPVRINSIIKLEESDIAYDKNKNTYNGSDGLLTKDPKRIFEYIQHDAELMHYYNAYVINRNVMYDIESNDDVNDYINFLKSNPVLLSSLEVFFPLDMRYRLESDDYRKLRLTYTEIKKLISDTDNGKTPTYNHIKNIHSQLINSLEILENTKIEISFDFENAKLVSIRSSKSLGIDNFNVDTIYVDIDSDPDDDYYPSLSITNCNIKKLVFDTNLSRFIVKSSNINEMVSNNKKCTGMYLDYVNVGINPINLPNCSESLYIGVNNSNINYSNFIQMLNSNIHGGRTKILTPDNFLDEYRRKVFLKNTTIKSLEDIDLFKLEFTGRNELVVVGTSHIESVLNRFDASNLIITDNLRVHSLKYKYLFDKYKNLPEDMFELFVGILSK